MQALTDAVAIEVDAANAFADGISRQSAVGSEVEQVALLRADRRQLTFELLAERYFSLMLLDDRLAKRRAHEVHESRREGQFEVVLRNCIFEHSDWGVPTVALVRVLIPTEEVEVDTTSTLSAVKNHASFATAVCTPPAIQRALQVVVIDAAALVDLTSRSNDGLHAVKQLVVDQRIMASRIVLTCVEDIAKVVPVLQNPRDMLRSELTGWSA